MKLSVKYMAQLRNATGVAVEEVELPQPSHAVDLLRLIGTRHGEQFQRMLMSESGTLQSTVLMFVNDEQVLNPDDVQLNEGDVVTFLSPIAGG